MRSILIIASSIAFRYDVLTTVATACVRARTSNTSCVRVRICAYWLPCFFLHVAFARTPRLLMLTCVYVSVVLTIQLLCTINSRNCPDIVSGCVGLFLLSAYVDYVRLVSYLNELIDIQVTPLI